MEKAAHNRENGILVNLKKKTVDKAVSRSTNGFLFIQKSLWMCLVQRLFHHLAHGTAQWFNRQFNSVTDTRLGFKSRNFPLLSKCCHTDNSYWRAKFVCGTKFDPFATTTSGIILT